MVCAGGAPELNSRCRSPADEYILYGCFNQHITEISLCAEHAMKWMFVQTSYKHKCGRCDDLIEEYLPLRIYNGQ